MDFSQKITLVEVGPRDGLQNEPTSIPTSIKLQLIQQLSQCGFSRIEVSSFVSNTAIPQLADSQTLFASLPQQSSIRYSALIPNEQGMLKALDAGVKEIAIFTAASETFNQRNIHCSIAESIQRFLPVIALARTHQIFVRAYISCVLGCPYEGSIQPRQVLDVIEQLLLLGVDEISLGDTIGVGTPQQTKALIQSILPIMPMNQLALHCHDTYGQAIANIYAALELGMTCFDSSVAGLGGCPYARGATGNVATEDVLYLLHGLGLHTGIDIFQVVRTGDMICQFLNRQNQSKVARALLAQGVENACRQK